MKWPGETLQNLPYFIYTKTQSCFFHFSFRATLFFPLMNALVYVDIDIREKNKVARNEKRKNLHEFSYSKNMANFEMFCWVISSSINLLFLKSDGIYIYTWFDLWLCNHASKLGAAHFFVINTQTYLRVISSSNVF